MDAGQLIEHAGERRRHRRVRVYDRARLVAAVDAEMQIELRRGLELARDDPPVEVHDRHLLRLEAPELSAGRGDRYAVSRRALMLPAVPMTSPSAASRRLAAATCLRSSSSVTAGANLHDLKSRILLSTTRAASCGLRSALPRR